VTDRSLIGQLLGWQVLITATACLLLVAGTVVASALILRAQQDSDLSELSQTMCAGIWHELAEPYPVTDLATAGQHFFGESSIDGFELELWSRNGELLAHIGDYPELAAPRSQVRLPSSCSSLTATSPVLGTQTVRACVQLCDDDHFTRVATRNALYDPAIRRAMLILLAALPIAVLIGAWIGRLVIRRLLRPLDELTRSTAEIEPGRRMALGVKAQSRELHHLELAFDALLERLERMLAREKRFAQEAAHELRTPLTNLRLRMERLCKDAGDDPEMARQTCAALANLDSLDQLIESLLILARSEGGDLPVAPVNICDLIREIAAGPDAEAGAPKTTVEVDAPDEVLVLGNEELLIQAVTNVLENARKYAGQSATIRLGASKSDGHGVISVEDDGPGIPVELREIVFERFYRGPVHRNHVPGTGLGLSVVDAIVRRHGGRVEAGPSALGGERLRIAIPLFPEDSEG
jgi:signal transduction histidine kinase